jgi:hypothetical protein
MNHATTSFSTEMFAGAIMSVVQYLAPLRVAMVTPSALPREVVERSAKALSWRTPTALARLLEDPYSPRPSLGGPLQPSPVSWRTPTALARLLEDPHSPRPSLGGPPQPPPIMVT